MNQKLDKLISTVKAVNGIAFGEDTSTGDITRESHRHTRELVSRLVERLNRNDEPGQQAFAAAVILEALANHQSHGDDAGAEKLAKALVKEPVLKQALADAYAKADPWAQEVLDEANIDRPRLEPLSDDDRFPQTGHSGHGYESPTLTVSE